MAFVVRLKNEVSDRYWGSDFDYSKFETRVELYGHYRWNYPSLDPEDGSRLPHLGPRAFP